MHIYHEIQKEFGVSIEFAMALYYLWLYIIYVIEI